MRGDGDPGAEDAAVADHERPVGEVGVADAVPGGQRRLSPDQDVTADVDRRDVQESGGREVDAAALAEAAEPVRERGAGHHLAGPVDPLQGGVDRSVEQAVAATHPATLAVNRFSKVSLT